MEYVRSGPERSRDVERRTFVRGWGLTPGPPVASAAARVLGLQRAAGNRAVAAMLAVRRSGVACGGYDTESTAGLANTAVQEVDGGLLAGDQGSR
jgi:hypothetical protein